MTSSSILDNWLHGLPEPVKNRFFYGMLLNEQTLFRDQDYFEAKRWLLNRLSLGKGVLSGLDYTYISDKTNLPPEYKISDAKDAGPWIVLQPGVALDGYGRELVVPSTTTPDRLVFPVGITLEETTPVLLPSDLTAFVGFANKQLDPSKTAGTFVFRLVFEIAYNSVPIDSIPIRAGNCPSKCEPSAVREGYKTRFRLFPQNQPDLPLPGAPNEEPPRSGQLSDIFPTEPLETIRHRQRSQLHTDLTITADPAQSPDKDPDWIPLGVLQCEVRDLQNLTSPTITNLGRYFRQIYSNDALSRLVYGLCERVDEAARVRVLTYASTNSGQGQTANVYDQLTDPLSVKVVNSLAGSFLDLGSVQVLFTILTKDGGTLAPPVVRGTGFDWSNGNSSITVPVNIADGTAQVAWRLGKAPGLHSVSARIVPKNPSAPPFHPGSQILFHATAQPTAPTIVGMELLHWYHHHNSCVRWHQGHAKLRIIFSRKMDPAALANPGEWLSIWRMIAWRDATVSDDTAHPTTALPLGPQKVEITPVAGFQPFGNGPDEQSACFVDFYMRDLLKHLCDDDTLRLLVMIRPSPNLKSIPGSLFPMPQMVAADLDGSFVPKPDRDQLFGLTQASGTLLTTETYSKVLDQDQLPSSLSIQKQQAAALQDMWYRFHPRECSLPSRSGPEGGEFHKTFELRLPKC